MIKNHSRFQDPIVIPFFTFHIKECVCMTRNKSKKHISNTISDFFGAKHF